MNDRTFLASDAHKLEDPKRLEWLPPSDVLKALRPFVGRTVADIGAGTGYFTLPMAEAADGPSLIYAVDIQPKMLSLLKDKLTPTIVTRVRLSEGTATQSTLATGCCDLILLANIWHELDDRPMVLAECRRVVKDGGRIAILDWRPDVDATFGPPLPHRIPADAVETELKESGWMGVRRESIGLYSYLVTATL
jgi:ubiquinone/menaquinone biosynthesis C-methylase UbiE